MVRIAEVDRNSVAGGTCPCGGVLQPALRYEPTMTRPVLTCWSCGLEDPPYHTPGLLATYKRVCAWCSNRFRTSNPRRLTCSVDCDQRRRIARETAMLEGQRHRQVAP
jgi:hypothetical protein